MWNLVCMCIMYIHFYSLLDDEFMYMKTKHKLWVDIAIEFPGDALIVTNGSLFMKPSMYLHTYFSIVKFYVFSFE